MSDATPTVEAESRKAAKLKEPAQCRVCGRFVEGYWPARGDGTALFPRRHKHEGAWCTGYATEAVSFGVWEHHIPRPTPSASALAPPIPTGGGEPTYTQAEFDEAGDVGERDGYERAVADIDRLTGGDGEFSASTIPGHRCPDVETMKARIVARLPFPATGGAQDILRAKLSRFPDHGARDGAAVYKITGAEISTILDALGAGGVETGEPVDVGELPATIDRILQQQVSEDDYPKGAHRFFQESDPYGDRAAAVERIMGAVLAEAARAAYASPAAAVVSPARPLLDNGDLANLATVDHPDAYLNALLNYTRDLFGTLKAGGWKASQIADCFQHIERAARGLHAKAIASPPPAVGVTKEEVKAKLAPLWAMTATDTERKYWGINPVTAKKMAKDIDAILALFNGAGR